MKKYWFKRKTYGYGWTPSSVEGWLITGIYLIGIIYLSFSHAKTNIDHFFTYFILATLLLIVIVFKTGEKPKWQWGKNKH